MGGLLKDVCPSLIHHYMRSQNLTKYNKIYGLSFQKQACGNVQGRILAQCFIKH